MVADEVPGCGPLGGIVAALEQSEWEWNLFLPVDVPLVPAVALRELMGLADAGCVAVLTETEGRVNPLCGVYARRALPVLREELAGGRLKVRVAAEKAGCGAVLEDAGGGGGFGIAIRLRSLRGWSVGDNGVWLRMGNSTGMGCRIVRRRSRRVWGRLRVG